MAPRRWAPPGRRLAAVRRLLLAAAALAPALAPGGEAKKPRAKEPPVAVEAQFKERLSRKLGTSLDAATGHLAWALGVAPAGTGAAGSGAAAEDEAGGAFGRYELDVAGGADAVWRRRCEQDVAPDRDSPVLCATHRLQALTALCEVDGAAERHRDGVTRLLRQLLVRRERLVEGLGVKRSLLPVANNLEAWMAETSLGSANFDVSVPLHAAAMLAVVRCAGALGLPELFKDVQAWFVAIERLYPRVSWAQSSFHSNAILLESFVQISHSVRQDSSFAEDIRQFVSDFETYLLNQFANEPGAWSFSGAHAASLAWASERRSRRRRRYGEAMVEYLQRWRLIAPNLNVSTTYTCGPLQGVSPLLMKRGQDAAEVVSTVLRMAEKDVDLFQVLDFGGGNLSLAAQRLDATVRRRHGGALQGAFLRDERQLQAERRISIRIDDTAQCVMGLSRTLKLLDDLMGVEVPEHGGTEGAFGPQVGVAGGPAAERATERAPPERPPGRPAGPAEDSNERGEL